jgi:hypothetical protein
MTIPLVIMGVAVFRLKLLDAKNGEIGAIGYRFLLAITGVHVTNLISTSSASLIFS